MKPARNKLCPCGSGKKYKKCCGIASNTTVKHLEKTPSLDITASLATAWRHFQSGRFQPAKQIYQQILNIQPNNTTALHQFSGLATLLGDYELAISLLGKAIKIQPKNAELFNSLGCVRINQRLPQKALEYFNKALTLRNNYAEAHLNRAKCFKAQGKLEKAIDDYKKATKLKPEQVLPKINLLYSLNFAPTITPEEIAKQHQIFAHNQENPIRRLPHQRTVTKPAEGQKLKIGYVSSDFRTHSVSYFVEPVLRHHNKDNFDIFCYYNNHYEDETTSRIRALSGHWKNITALSDKGFAELVTNDGINILVDLMGYTANTRTLAFAYKPAPIQLSWLGYPNTTGLASMNYRLTDHFTDPPGISEHLYSERLLRMENCFCCYQPPNITLSDSKIPREKDGPITFASFNNFAKTTPDVLNLWAKILNQTPSSRLILKSAGLSDRSMAAELHSFFASKGIKSERISLLDNDHKLSDHFKRYQGVDIALDPFPYNGTTTTFEALWMGTPVITLVGNSHRSRVGYSLLHNLGMQELAAKDEEDYLRIATKLPQEPTRLANYHKTLRKKLKLSSLMNHAQFTKELENIYLTIYKSLFQ